MAIIKKEGEENDDKHQQQQHQPKPIQASKASSLQSVRSRKLPTEILVEIFLKKLPFKSLLRCKSVCKLWYSLISDPHFVKSHLNLSANNNSRLIFNVWCSPILNTCWINDVMAGNFIDNAFEVVDYPFNSACMSACVVGSCNGLLCLLTRIRNDTSDDILFILNPSTRKYNRLPLAPYRTIHFGFGYDESTDDYKVVSISSNLRNTNTYDVVTDTFVNIYSLRNGGWKDFGAFPYGDPCDIWGTFLNGALHWEATCIGVDDFKIISLDLATETYGEVIQPVYDEFKYRTVTLGTLGEWLCVLCDYCQVRMDFWVMKVYGVEDSWTKLVSFLYMPDYPMNDHRLKPLCMSNDGRILLTFGKELMIYDSKNNLLSDVQNFDDCIQASTYVESLVSPLPPAAALAHRVADSNG